MKKISSSCMLICLFFLLASCGRSYPNRDYNETVFQESNRGVVFTKLGKKNQFFDTETKAAFEIVKIDPRTFLSSSGGLRYQIGAGWLEGFKLKNMSPWSKPHEMLMIEPGTYVIENISVEGGNVHYRSRFPGLVLGQVSYGGFTVKPGEVIYLGDLYFEVDVDKSFYLSKEDNFLKLQKAVKKSHPYLAEKLKKATFFEKGSRPFQR